jgi:diketogulonate reductase-like aldo/keto reductase
MEDETMAETGSTTRREFLGFSAVAASLAALAGSLPRGSLAQPSVPQRPIPSTGEMLPVVGFGSSKIVEQIATNGTEPVVAVLHSLLTHGGKFVDTWPRNADNDAAFGRVIGMPEFRNRLFVASKVDVVGKEAGIAQFRQTQKLYGRETLDLVQIFSMTDVDTHWPSLKEWKTEGWARYIGVTVSQASKHEELMRFLGREKPDFVQMNYSITEREVEKRLLPYAADRGVAIVINRPFMNGAFFDKLEGMPLPDWAAEFDCRTWAQFSLKYILANSQFTCVLTETADPQHIADNLATASGPLPDAAMRQRMRDFIDRV